MTPLAAIAILGLQAQSLDKEFDAALGLAGLTTETATFDEGILRFYRQGQSPTVLFESSFRSPWRAPFYADMARRQAALGAGRVGTLVETASRLLGRGSRRALLGDPAKPFTDQAAGASPLTAALQKMKEAGLVKGNPAATDSVPLDVQRSAAAVVFAALGLVEYRRAAIADVPDPVAAFKELASSGPETTGPLAEARQRRLQGQVDTALLFALAQDFGAAVVWAAGNVRSVPPAKAYDWSCETEWGRIVLTGGKDDTHQGVATFLVVDTGGDDVYINVPATSSPANWASTVVDTQGDDKYLSDPSLAKTQVASWPNRAQHRGRPGPGSALFGVSFLEDLSGNDLYRSARSSFGSATFGVACVHDAAGNDKYDGYGETQGYGFYGVGVLDDSGGDDRYDCFFQGQGAGLPQGFGMLIDEKGDDVYTANDKEIDSASSQSADHNTSMAQGAGFGFRADYLTGHSQSGGIGVLYDLEGKDAYTCGVFGQGVGYWEGAGYLWDDAGDDTYVGQWYVQGAAAHFAIGCLEDRAGHDVYDAFLNMAQGAGHDFSVGFLVDWAGNDKYRAPNLSLGAGNANGIGAFVDLGGDDAYASSGVTLGSAAEAQKASMRERALCFGAFMDLGGNDTYPDASTWALNGARTANWNAKREPVRESQVGVFLDR